MILLRIQLLLHWKFGRAHKGPILLPWISFNWALLNGESVVRVSWYTPSLWSVIQGHLGNWWSRKDTIHYSDVIMSTMASQIIGISIVYSTVCLGADQRKHQSSASLAFVRGIHRWSVNSPHKGPNTRKMFPFDDVIMSLSSPWVAVSASVWWASAYRRLAALRTGLWLCQRDWPSPILWQGWEKTNMGVDI